MIYSQFWSIQDERATICYSQSDICIRLIVYLILRWVWPDYMTFANLSVKLKDLLQKRWTQTHCHKWKKKKSFPIHTDTHFYLKCLKCENVHSKWKSICHLRLSDSLLPVHLQLLHSSRFYKCKAPLSAAAFFLFPYFISSTRLWSQKRLELDSGDPCL